MAKKTFYDVLQVSRNADPETIKATYKSLVQRYHPDKNPDNPDSEKHLKEINRAYEVLSDPVKRAGYDASFADDDGQTVSRKDWSGFSSGAAPAENDTNPKAHFDRSTAPANKRGYLWLLDLLPMAAVAQVFKSLVLTTFHGSPEASGLAVFFSMGLGGAVGYILCHYARTKITKNMQSRGAVIFWSLFISLGLMLSIITATALLEQSANKGTIMVTYVSEKEAFAPPVSGYISEDEATTGVPPASPGTALQQAKALAEQGDTAAQANLGVMYANGEGVIRDYQEALKWFRLSAAQGDITGQLALGMMYANSHGVPQDYQEAGKWYRLAAAQGSAMAQCNLGVMYHRGLGVPHDYAQAMMWYLIAKAGGAKLVDQYLQGLETLSTPAQIAEAQRMAREWRAEHPQKN